MSEQEGSTGGAAGVSVTTVCALHETIVFFTCLSFRPARGKPELTGKQPSPASLAKTCYGPMKRKHLQWSMVVAASWSGAVSQNGGNPERLQIPVSVGVKPSAFTGTSCFNDPKHTEIKWRTASLQWDWGFGMAQSKSRPGSHGTCEEGWA